MQRPTRATAPEVKERILSAFSVRAQKGGIREVRMARLAAELRMSATTLYKHFPSKDHLVRAMATRWAEELSASDAVMTGDATVRTADQHMLNWAEAWGQTLSQFAPEFWRDLREDHPEGWRIFQREVRRRKAAGASLLRPYIARDISAEMALAVLDLLIEQSANPRLCNRLGISREDAVRTAIRIWRQGALRSE